MLWTAPELLRLQQAPPYGTNRGDIYSFAIILQEMFLADQPYAEDLNVFEQAGKHQSKMSFIRNLLMQLIYL